jgi:tRNA 5-methylaminomethyl-2-thiouridine biosynthesis bifunctional protein
MSQPHSKTLAAPSLTWNDAGQPLSNEYEDYYFNTESGLDETVFTFIEPNHLAQRFNQIQNHASSVFTIIETGFGTGLSFLCTQALWNDKAPEHARLHFISIENHPLSHEQLRQSLALWPQFQVEAEELLLHYPISIKGFHTLTFETNNVSLTLLFGNTDEQLPLLESPVDAWFLDGFAPSKNPDMWSPALFSNMARLSHSKTTFATFTAASVIRKQLIGAGFKVNKIAGFGKKRHILNGNYISSQGPTTPYQYNKPWLIPQPNTSETVIVIGAGLAGCTTAEALAQRGKQVILLERHHDVAQEASGNAQGVLYAKMAADSDSKHSDFYLQGYMHTLNVLNKNLDKDIDENWNDCGVLQLAYNDKEEKRQTSFFSQQQFPHSLLHQVSPERASELANTPLTRGGVFFPQGGWVHPPALCRAISRHKNIRHQFHQHALSLTQVNNDWIVTDENGAVLAKAGAVVVACANQSHLFEQLKWLPTKSIRGQITSINKPEKSGLLTSVLCGKGYITPDRRGVFNFGATFNLKDDNPELNPDHHNDNQRMFRDNFPDLADELLSPSDKLTGRVSFRCTTPDYLPLVGPILDVAAFKDEFGMLRKNASWPFSKPAPFFTGLYVNLGHGSRGLVSAPLSAQMLAGEICGEAIQVPQYSRYMLNPSRFLIRNMIRKKE